MIWYDMIWRDNSNIVFKWNISKIITPTLIAKISFEDSKSLLFLHFLNRRKNSTYTDNCTSTFLILIFILVRYTYYSQLFISDRPLSASFVRFSLLFSCWHQPTHSSIFPLISPIFHIISNSFCIPLRLPLCRWQHR